MKKGKSYKTKSYRNETGRDYIKVKDREIALDIMTQVINSQKINTRKKARK